MRSTSLGDFVVFLPFLAKVQKTFGSDMVDLLIVSRTGDVVSLVLGDTPTVYALIDPRSGASLAASIVAARARLRFRGYYQVLYATQGADLVSGRLRRLLLIRAVVGLAPRVVGMTVHPVVRSRVQLMASNAVAVNVAVAPFIACGVALPASRRDTLRLIGLTDAEVSTARNLIRKFRMGLSGSVIAMHVHAKDERKRWPGDRFSALIAEIRVRYPDDRIVLVGGREDRSASERILGHHSAGYVVCVAGQLTVRESLALLSECQYFIGSDGSPAHLAALVGCKVVSLFCDWEPAGLWEPIAAARSVSLRPARSSWSDPRADDFGIAEVPIADVLSARSYLDSAAGHSILRVGRGIRERIDCGDSVLGGGS